VADEDWATHLGSLGSLRALAGDAGSVLIDETHDQRQSFVRRGAKEHSEPYLFAALLIRQDLRHFLRFRSAPRATMLKWLALHERRPIAACRFRAKFWMSAESSMKPR